MKRIELTPHLSITDLGARYDQATTVTERTHWHVLWLYAQGRSVTEVAALTRVSRSWIYTLLHRYNAHGPAAMGDQRQHNPGQPPHVPPALRAELEPLLDGPAPDGGLWTSAKVATWLSPRLGHPVHPQRGWELLRALGYRPTAPRPRHRKADPEVQAAWKKNSLT
jgi:transposase